MDLCTRRLVSCQDPDGTFSQQSHYEGGLILKWNRAKQCNYLEILHNQPDLWRKVPRTPPKKTEAA